MPHSHSCPWPASSSAPSSPPATHPVWERVWQCHQVFPSMPEEPVQSLSRLPWKSESLTVRRRGRGAYPNVEGRGASGRSYRNESSSSIHVRCRKSRESPLPPARGSSWSVSYTHLRAHETPEHLVCRLLLEKKKN